MQREASAELDAIVVARGYGLKIRVERRHLMVCDGVGRSRRIRRFHPAACKIKRLVVVGHTGFITLDAMRWLHDQRAGLLNLDVDGRLLATSVVPGPTFPALRRAQALAASSSAGLELAREVLGTKVEGQRALLPELPGGASQAHALDRALNEIRDAKNMEVVLRAQAQAASAYWQAWSALPIPFPAGTISRVPQHWLTFGQRASLLTGSPRSATDPANAILNYLYALLEAETVLACHEVGLDPTLGVFHVDRRDRCSLALDVLEAARPVVDAYVLALLTQRTLSLGDVVETKQGGCRLAPRLVESFVELLPALRVEIAPLVEGVAHLLADSADGRVPRLTPLTRANWKAAWGSRDPTRRRRTKAGTTLQLAATCRDCGVPVPTRRQRYCASCRAQRFEREGSNAREQAARVLAQLRAEQRDPGHGGRAARLRGAKNSAHQKAVRRWVGERPDPALFGSEVLPGLKLLPIRIISEATGLSEHYCSLIRLGKRVPHPRHWEALARIGGTEPAATR
jgi:CRISPR-associated endonuclease Cas1